MIALLLDIQILGHISVPVTIHDGKCSVLFGGQLLPVLDHRPDSFHPPQQVVLIQDCYYSVGIEPSEAELKQALQRLEKENEELRRENAHLRQSLNHSPRDETQPHTTESKRSFFSVLTKDKKHEKQATHEPAPSHPAPDERSQNESHQTGEKKSFMTALFAKKKV